MAKFPQRLRELRKEKGLSQKEFAAQIGISKSSVNMYERGEREPGIETLEAIADYFNSDLDYLLGKSNVKNRFQSFVDDLEDSKESGRSDAIRNLINAFGDNHEFCGMTQVREHGVVIYYQPDADHEVTIYKTAIIHDLYGLTTTELKLLYNTIHGMIEAMHPGKNVDLDEMELIASFADNCFHMPNITKDQDSAHKRRSKGEKE